MQLLKSLFQFKKRGFLSCKLLLVVIAATAGSIFCVVNYVGGINNNKSVNVTNSPAPKASPQPSVQPSPQEYAKAFPKSKSLRIIFLHHSTGSNIWEGGVAKFMDEYNRQHGTSYQLQEMSYPEAENGYPWENYPYDYYNLWVKNQGTEQAKKEMNLDQIAANYDIIVFKHCFPVSEIKKDTGKPDINSKTKSLENYKLQYNALKDRMHQFPNKRFLVWTGASLTEDATTQEQAQRAKEWAKWVKTEWNTPGDNIFVFDFEQLETDGGLYMKYPSGKSDSHPESSFSKKAAEAFVKRLVEVLETPVLVD